MTGRDQTVGGVAALERRPRAVWRLRLGSRRRLTLPPEIRKQFGLKPGDTVVMRCDDAGIHIEMPGTNSGDEDSRTVHTVALPPKRDE